MRGVSQDLEQFRVVRRWQLRITAITTERSSEANKGSLTAESKHPYKRHLFMSSSCAVQLRGNKRTSTQEPAKQIVPDPRNPTENIITDAP